MSSKQLIVRVTRKGQVTIPKKFRNILNIKEGDSLYVRLDGDKIVFTKPGIPDPGEPVGEEEYNRIIGLLEEERRKWS
ncbi:MAG: AbrB family transcriptional regulator [Thermoproteota archaeon]|nr:MAG: AbrB family transcriptional regulator [Candidatus Korarchaeota archaeon]